MWKWLFKLSSPKLFYAMTTGILPWLAWTAVVLITIGLIWGLMFSPPDYQMGHYYRIIYVHVASAGLMKGCYWMMALMSIGVLVWNIKMADIVAKACAPIGITTTALALASGSIWGIPSWGTWWIWDARLTSTLIMLFIYIGIFVLRGAFDSQNSAAKACSVLTLVGLINLPIIEYSVEWWHTLHQSSSSLGGLSDGAVNPPGIFIPAIFLGFGVIAFFFLCVILKSRNEILIRERRSQWVIDLIAEEIEEEKAYA